MVPFAGRVPPLVSATAQGGLKLLAVRPTLSPTVGEALGTSAHLVKVRGPEPSLPGSRSLWLVSAGGGQLRGQPTWHGLRDFVLGASPPSCKTGSVSMSPRKPLPSPGSCWSTHTPKRTAHRLLCPGIEGTGLHQTNAV